jgi:nicotinate phosphoribosyltransferase
MKLSTAKVTAPGPKQVFRRSYGADVIALKDEDVPPGAEPLLVTVASHGRRTSKPEPLARAHARFAADLAALPHNARRIHDPIPPQVTRSAALEELTHVSAAGSSTTYWPPRR